MRIRQKDDDPSLFAPEPVLPLWRGWLAFASNVPLMLVFLIGLPMAVAVGVLWFKGGWNLVWVVWADRTPSSSLPALEFFGLLLVATCIGIPLFVVSWWALFVWSGFIDERAYERYFDLKQPKRSVQAALVWLVVSGVILWLFVALLPA